MSCGTRIERNLENKPPAKPPTSQKDTTIPNTLSRGTSNASGAKENIKIHKSAGARIFGLIKAFFAGLGIQMVGEILDKFLWIETYPGSGVGVVSMLFTFLGFVAMAYFAYKWAIK